jgi:arylsulfatase A-like enzyme
MNLRIVLIILITAACGRSVSPRPNLILVLADQLRYQSVGYAGDVKAHTPNIDRLADQGLSFSNFASSTPVCAATRATLWTGKYASTTGMVVNELRINPNHDGLGHVLSAAGYQTDYIGKWHLWANEPGNHLEARNGHCPPGAYRLGFDGFWAGYNFNHQNYRAYYFRDNPERIPIEGYGPEHFTDLALERIRRHADRDEPFALVLSLSPPHPPFTKDNVAPAWYSRFESVSFELPPTWKDTPDPRMDRDTDPERWLEYWKPNLPEFLRVYYAMNASLDEQLGRILDALDELHLADDTVVVFTSDHGEMFGAHGRVQKMTFYEESVRVPMLIRWPAHVPPGGVSDACMATPDLMPTLLGLMDLPIPSGVEGTDLSHLARGESGPEPEFAFLQGMGHTYLWNDGFEWRGLRDKRYTYAVYRSDGKELIFDNLNDPTQTTNLAADPGHRSELEMFRQKLKMKMAALGDTFESCSWYRDQWTENRVILRGARGEFHREHGPNIEVDVQYQPIPAQENRP